MRVGIGYCDNPDSTIAGREATKEALAKAGRKDPCDLVLLFCTARHNQQELRAEVADLIGKDTDIYGGGTVGVITNDTFGYAGDQVGIACIWLDGSEWKVTVEGGLEKGEYEAGKRLGESLRQQQVAPDSPVMLLYDAVNQEQEGLGILMATWILEGLKEGLGFFPNLVGAGTQGDHICTPTGQFIDDRMGQYNALAFTFSEDIEMDSVIMHGCRPASPFYTVTKADGPVILEINGEPAISFVDHLLGPTISPKEYPFFLLFGIHYGEVGEDYLEDNYASRLCLDIDEERGGIIMFEPDMLEGTRFQIMFRSLDLNYMEPRINRVFDELDADREPFFAFYIDCAGRCAGYGGTEIEDAYVVQNVVQDRVPLLGLYTGVEIGSIGGRPRGLDWTGVFCLFSQRKKGVAPKTTVRQPAEEKPIPMNSAVTLSPEQTRGLLEQNLVKVLSLDVQSIAIRHELEQKRRGFSLLAELAVSLRQKAEDENIFLTATKRINATLNMQKTAVLLQNTTGKFEPVVLQGYSMDEIAEVSAAQIVLTQEQLQPMLVTGADAEDYMAELRQTLHLPYFVSVPVLVENKVVAVLLTGRMMEAPPFLSRLGHTDVETLQAIGALLAAILVHQRLDDVSRLARTDVLTGLRNRGVLEEDVTNLLNEKLPEGVAFAMLMLDIDNFKLVNDSFGHMCGDEVLKKLADILRKNFRGTDIIARMGGDEFVVFCQLDGNEEQFIEKVSDLVETWAGTAIEMMPGKEIYSCISVGMSVAPRDGVSYQALMQRADTALYRSKETGRGKSTVYRKEMEIGKNKE